MHIRLGVNGEPHHLPAGTALTAYRAVQEALTNTVNTPAEALTPWSS
jgi:signal transduction histidine kinase